MKKIRWQERRTIFNKINESRQQGFSDTEICDQLNSLGYRTSKGNPFKNNTIHQFIYTCKKSGMRETKQRGPKQMPLTAHAVDAKDTIDYLLQPKIKTNSAEQIELIAEVGSKINDTETRKKVISALVEALL